MKEISKREETPAVEPVPAEISRGELERQSFLEHIRALRKLILVSVISVIVGFLIFFFGLGNQILSLLTNPITNRGIDMVQIGMTEVLTAQLKVSFIAGVVAAAPVILFQIWSFIAPALYVKERRMFTLLYLTAILLFVGGILFAYLLVFNIVVNFFITFGQDVTTPMLSLKTYVDFLFAFILPFGIVFELPVAIALLTRIGLVKPATLKKVRKYVFFGVFVLSAVLTPPDIFSLIMLAIPLYILYEVGIVVSSFVTIGKKKRKEAKEAADQ